MFIISILGFISCNTTEPLSEKVYAKVLLSLSSVSSIETWINIKTSNLDLPADIVFLRDNLIIRQLVISTNDTTIYVDSLLPNSTYRFTAHYYQYNSTFASNELSVKTLDTTSSNFTWQTFTFGAANAGSSHLSDVAIIDENNIWAVGEIYMDDSTGNPDPLRYNGAHWDGNGWTVIRIPYYYQGQPYYNPIQTVFAFGANDIWFAGNGVLHWDGSQYVPVPLPTNVWGQDQINKIWGSSSQDLYIVGNTGSIAHYNGSTWQKIESGTTTDIIDIWGVTNNSPLIYCTASNILSQGDH
ncbi:MAG: hypothetical protein WB779_13480 [Ignavibacteriaceae bacterium]